MTSLVDHLETLSYAEIGQIAKTFDLTVDQVLAMVENNGDNTFNAGDLINSLDFDKANEEFARALSSQMQTVTSNMTSAMLSFIEAGSDGRYGAQASTDLQNAVNDFQKGMQALGINAQININNLTSLLIAGGQKAVAAAQKIAALSGQELSAQDVESLYLTSIGALIKSSFCLHIDFIFLSRHNDI